MFSSTVENGVVYLAVSSYYFSLSHLFLGSGGGRYLGGGFFLLVNTNDFWVTIPSILTPFALAAASVIFSQNLRGISYFSGDLTACFSRRETGQQSIVFHAIFVIFLTGILLPSSYFFGLFISIFYPSSPQRRVGTKMRTKKKQKKKEIAWKWEESLKGIHFF